MKKIVEATHETSYSLFTIYTANQDRSQTPVSFDSVNNLFKRNSFQFEDSKKLHSFLQSSIENICYFEIDIMNKITLSSGLNLDLPKLNVISSYVANEQDLFTLKNIYENYPNLNDNKSFDYDYDHYHDGEIVLINTGHSYNFIPLWKIQHAPKYLIKINQQIANKPVFLTTEFQSGDFYNFMPDTINHKLQSVIIDKNGEKSVSDGPLATKEDFDSYVYKLLNNKNRYGDIRNNSIYAWGNTK